MKLVFSAAGTRSLKACKRGWMWTVIIAYFTGVVGAFTGCYARQLLPNLESASAAFGSLMNVLPIPLAACIMAGLMAATMSTCDIYLVSGVNQLVRDVAQYFLKIRDTKKLLQWAKWGTIIYGMASVAFAIFWKGGLSYLFAFGTGVGAPLFVYYLDSWLLRVGNQAGAISSVAVSMGIVLYWDILTKNSAQVNSLWDHAYYNGRYYVYFGIVPCLLFQLPFEAVTGIQNLAYPPCMIVMGLLFLLASFGAVHQMVRRWFSQASAAAYLLSVAAIVLGSQLYYLFVRPYIYEYAIVCGTSLLMLALWFWLSAANTAVERRGALLAKLALGSLCMALVAGCRPQMELFAVLALPIFWQRYIAQKRLRSRAGAGEAAAFLLPVVLVAAGLMWYNYARFGSPFDFGANYNLTGNDMTKRGFNVVRIGPAVFTSLFDLPRLKSVFPFLQETEVTTNAVIRTISEPFVGGMLAATPFTWVLGLLALPQTRQSLRRRPGAAGFVWLAVAGMVIITVVDCEMAGVLYRYLMDYSPVLLLGAVLCWLLLESVLARRAAAGETLAVTLLPVLRVAMAAAVAWSAVYRFFTLFATQPWLQGLNPSLYFNVARLVQFWM